LHSQSNIGAMSLTRLPAFTTAKNAKGKRCPGLTHENSPFKIPHAKTQSRKKIEFLCGFAPLRAHSPS
jgi:hypothetical protein